MDILGKLKGRNITSSILHILFNAVFAAMVFLAINIGGQIEVALILILVSKWRIFAVRSRYWGVNILANLVDIVVISCRCYTGSTWFLDSNLHYFTLCYLVNCH